MSLDGRINVDTLIHDRDGTTSVKILSLASSKPIAIGEAVVVTGTASDYTEISFASYRNAAGQLVDLNSVKAIAFAWSGTNAATLLNSGDSIFHLQSLDNQVAVTYLNGESATPALYPGGTGTYTLILWGET
jgi:hypothetical protein